MRIGTNGPAVAGEEVHGRAVGPGVEARAERHGRWHPPLQRRGGCKKLQLDPALLSSLPRPPAGGGPSQAPGWGSGWRGRSVAGWVAHGRHVGAGTTHQAITAGIDQATLSRRTHGDRNGTRRHRDVASRDT